MLRNKGFSLVEILVATAIFFLILVGASKLISSFGLYTKKQLVLSCLVQAADSAIDSCKAGVPINSIKCGGLTINITLSGSCNPPLGVCNVITAQASYGKYSYSLSNEVCNLE